MYAYEPGKKHGWSAVTPPLTEAVMYGVTDLLFLLVLQCPVGLYACKEVAVFHAAQFESQGDAEGIDATFVFYTICFNDHPQVLDLRSCVEAEVFIDIIIVIGAGIDHPGETGDAQLLIALIGVVNLGNGELGSVEVNGQVAGMGWRRALLSWRGRLLAPYKKNKHNCAHPCQENLLHIHGN